MQQSGDSHQTLTFRLILTVSLIILFILAVSILGQQNQPGRIPATATLSPSPTASRTPSPTATRTPTPTPLPPTSTLANIRPTQLFTLGQGTISGVTRSPDGKLIAIIDNSTTLKWFDALTYQLLGEVLVGEYVRDSIVFSPDSRSVVVQDYFSGILINLLEQSDPYPICSGYAGCGGIVFSTDGRYIAYTIYDSSTGGPYYAIGVWDAAGHKPAVDYLPTLLEFRYHTMSDPAISPDGQHVAAGHSDGRVYVWNVENGETRFILEGHGREVTSVDFSPDGRYLASGSEDGTVRLWSPSSGQLLRVVTGLLDDVTEVKFTADGRQLRIGVSDQANQVYDLNSGQLTPWQPPQATPDPFEALLYAQGYIEAGLATRLTFSPDGSSLAVGRGVVQVWDITTQHVVTALEVPQDVTAMHYSPDGERLGVINTVGDVLVWETTHWNLILSLSTALMSDGQPYFVSGQALGIGRRINLAQVEEFAFSPNGSRLAVGIGAAGEIWDIQNAVRLITLEQIQPFANITRISYSADGQRIYGAFRRTREAAVWDAASGRLLSRFDLTSPTQSVFTTSDLDGPFFVRNNADAQSNWIEIWNLDEQNFLQVGSPGWDTEPLRFSPDGSLLISSNSDWLYVWMRESGDLIAVTETGRVQGDLALSPDNTRLAIGSDGMVEIWDTSGIAGRAQGSFIPTVMPPLTDTPWPVDWQTPTPMPPLPVTPRSLPELPGGAISPANAAQVAQVGSFGAGRIEQVRWAGNNQLVVAGSLGVDTYTLQTTGALSAEPAHHATQFWVASSVVLSDGRMLTATTEGNRVQVWDLTSNEILVDLEGGGEPALSPDGRLLVYSGNYGYLYTWDLVAGGPVAALLASARHPVFSPDGKLIAGVIGWYSRHSQESVRVWDATSGVIVNALGGPDNAITDLSFSPDGRRIVAAAGGSAWVWDTRPGQPVTNTQLYPGEIDGNLTLYVHTVTAAALSPNGWTLAVGTSENTINLYSLGNQSPTSLLSGHSAAIEQLAFSPNGRFLLSLDADGAVLLWNVSTGELVEAIYFHYGEVRGLVFQENGSLIGWQAGTTWTFSPAAGEVLHTTQIFSGTILAVSPQGDWLAATYPYRVSLYNAVTGELWQTLEGEAPMPYVPYQLEGAIFQGYYGAAFSRDGNRLVVLGSGGANSYDARAGTLLLNIPAMVAYEADLSLDNQWLLMAPYDYWDYFGIFDLCTGNNIFDFPSLPVSYYGYKFSPDNRWVGVVSQKDQRYQFQLWDFASHTLLHALDFSEEIPLLSLAFSPDARLVALGQADGQIFLVDLSTFQVVATLSGHRGAVERLAFSPDGRYLASGGQDGTIRIWGVP
jgi:WD40 repeat protein